jgi:hypothetical protein
MINRILLSFAVILAGLPTVFAQVQIKVTLSGVPSTVTIEKKNLKYGKYGAFCFGWDDRAPSAFDALAVMSTHGFTDGAGNIVPYTGTIACNAVNRYLEDASGVTIAQLTTLVQNNWGIACHGYIHDTAIWASQGFTPLDNVIQNRTYFYNKLKAVGAEYVLRTGVVPNDDKGYQVAWKQIGSLCGTSEGTFDNMTATPYANWANNSIGDVTNFTAAYRPFARAFTGVDNQAGEDQMMSKLGSLIEQSTATSNKILVFGTHHTENSFFTPPLDYLENNSNDKIWVTSLHELMEYGETKDNTNITYTTNGNEVTINLNQNLPDAARWRDISLGIASDKNIVSLTYTGADNISYNTGTGLINVFKKKTSGFADPSLSQSTLPLHFTSLTVANNELKWTVADKDNFSHYEIEKSTDGINFSLIGHTTKETFSDPSITDNQFYRVKAVETNGKFVYSRTVRLSNAAKKKVTVNQSNGRTQVSFYSEAAAKGGLEVYGTNGQLLFQMSKQVLRGWNTSELNLTAPGVYIIKTPAGTVKYVKTDQ